MSFQKHLAAATALILGISSAAPPAVPAVAETQKTVLSATEDGITYSFYNEDLNDNDQVTLSSLSEKADQISEAVGDDASVYAFHADFSNSDGEEICPQGQIQVMLDGEEIREDGQNVRFFQISEDAMEDDLAMNLPDPQDMASDEDGNFWELDDGETNFAVVITPTENVSIDINGITLTAENAEKGASLSFVSKKNGSEESLLSGEVTFSDIE